jgi:hypothetical protein
MFAANRKTDGMSRGKRERIVAHRLVLERASPDHDPIELGDPLNQS